jgi:hydrogenase 3 maturation protease
VGIPGSTVRKQIENWLSNAERVVLAGIGNPIRMDDYVGVSIVQDLCGKLSERVLVIECETVPESFMQEIIDFSPTHVLLVDAAVLGLKPGAYRLIEPERLTVFPAFSTHMLPLRIFSDQVKEMTGAKIALLLVEPGKDDFGEGLTQTVKVSAKEIASTLLELLPR